ncbi:MAG TPA: hypothetical protein VGZ02_15400 [Candidatus Baltobacteraceae bacterium]|jgi:hypothetical protein|nr:hypothetical protein [Candidatus Baltobacteraceae bacterium]
MLSVARRAHVVLLAAAFVAFSACHGSSVNTVPVIGSSSRRQNAQGAGVTVRTLYTFSSTGEIIPSGPFETDANGDYFGTLHGKSWQKSYFFELTPSHTGLHETILYTFTPGTAQGTYVGPIARDAANNFWIVSSNGVFVLRRLSGAWTASQIQYCKRADFQTNDARPVVLASSVVSTCGQKILQMTPSGNWFAKTTVADFTGKKIVPNGGFAKDGNGNVYGTSWLAGGAHPGAGPTFELTSNGGTLSYSVLFGQYDSQFGPAIDANGNIWQSNETNGTQSVVEASSNNWKPSVVTGATSLQSAPVADADGNVFYANSAAIEEVSPKSGGGFSVHQLYQFGASDYVTGLWLDVGGHLFGLDLSAQRTSAKFFELTP